MKNHILNTIAVLLWIPVAAIKIILIVVGLVVVPATFPNLPALYRIGRGRPNTRWEAAIRNPVGGLGFILYGNYQYVQYGDVLEATFTDDKFQARFRRSGVLSGARFLWQYPKSRYGELYVGWTLGSAPPQLDFALSLRPWAKIGQ